MLNKKKCQKCQKSVLEWTVSRSSSASSVGSSCSSSSSSSSSIRRSSSSCLCIRRTRSSCLSFTSLITAVSDWPQSNKSKENLTVMPAFCDPTESSADDDSLTNPQAALLELTCDERRTLIANFEGPTVGLARPKLEASDKLTGLVLGYVAPYSPMEKSLALYYYQTDHPPMDSKTDRHQTYYTIDDYCKISDSYKLAEELPDNIQAKKLPDNKEVKELPNDVQAKELPDYIQTKELPDYIQTKELPDDEQPKELQDNKQAEELTDTFRIQNLEIPIAQVERAFIYPDEHEKFMQKRRNGIKPPSIISRIINIDGYHLESIASLTGKQRRHSSSVKSNRKCKGAAISKQIYVRSNKTSFESMLSLVDVVEGSRVSFGKVTEINSTSLMRKKSRELIRDGSILMVKPILRIPPPTASHNLAPMLEKTTPLFMLPVYTTSRRYRGNKRAAMKLSLK